MLFIHKKNEKGMKDFMARLHMCVPHCDKYTFYDIAGYIQIVCFDNVSRILTFIIRVYYLSILIASK